MTAREIAARLVISLDRRGRELSASDEKRVEGFCAEAYREGMRRAAEELETLSDEGLWDEDTLAQATAAIRAAAEKVTE